MEAKGVHFSEFHFHPVVHLPANYDVLDLSSPENEDKQKRSSEYSVGKYNEKREGLYTAEIFASVRNIHVGIDIGAPPGTEIFAPYAGEVFDFKDHKDAGNYGPTIILRHNLAGKDIYSLYGHLRRDSLAGLRKGKSVVGGEQFAWIGAETENGGWPPHLHFQLSWEEPQNCDMPGVVAEADLEDALQKYPDPQLMLGPLY